MPRNMGKLPIIMHPKLMERYLLKKKEDDFRVGNVRIPKKLGMNDK